MIIKLAADIEPAMKLGMQRKASGLKCNERDSFLHTRGKGVCHGLAEDKGEEGGATLPSIKKCSRVMNFMSSGKSHMDYHHSVKSPETTGTKTSYKLLSRDLPCTPRASKGQG